MKQSHLFVLIAAVIVVLGLAFGLRNRTQYDWQSTQSGVPAKVVSNPQLNDVTTIKIEAKSGAVNLCKTDAGWTVTEREGYPADVSQIGSVIRTIWDLKPVQAVEAGESQYPRLEVAGPKAEKGGGTLVEFGKGQPIASLILGKSHQTAGSDDSPYGPSSDGRYVLVPADKKIYLVAKTLDEITPEAARWLKKDFVDIDRVKSIQVTSKTETGWTLSRDSENGEWKLSDATEKEKVDPSKTSSAANLLGQFSDVAGKRVTVKDPFAEWTQAVITTFDGFTYTLLMGSEKEGNRYLTIDVAGDFAKERTAGAEEKPDDKKRLDDEFKASQDALTKQLEKEKLFEQWVYLVPSHALELLFKPRAELLAVEPTPAPEPAAGASAPAAE